MLSPDPGAREARALGELFPFPPFPAASDGEDAVRTEIPRGAAQPEQGGKEGEEGGIPLHVADKDQTACDPGGLAEVGDDGCVVGQVMGHGVGDDDIERPIGEGECCGGSDGGAGVGIEGAGVWGEVEVRELPVPAFGAGVGGQGTAEGPVTGSDVEALELLAAVRSEQSGDP